MYYTVFVFSSLFPQRPLLLFLFCLCGPLSSLSLLHPMHSPSFILSSLLSLSSIPCTLPLSFFLSVYLSLPYPLFCSGPVLSILCVLTLSLSLSFSLFLSLSQPLSLM